MCYYLVMCIVLVLLEQSDGWQCLKLILTFYCRTLHCHSRALPRDNRELYIHSCDPPLDCMRAMHVRAYFLPSTWIYVEMFLSRSSPTCQHFNPRANVEVSETLSVGQLLTATSGLYV